ncbi:MAG: hypothetical protein DME11_08285 [Candidatus Rokuibacteriota bacterium]|nr:MAG: hypothetical protein DME11_08285 [Candidatus Rokubacteria bacterium]
MTTLKTVMTIQAIILFVYGLPYLLVPRWTTAITQQATLPENYFLRAFGIPLVVLGLMELRIVGDLDRYRSLVILYALLPAIYFVTIVAQALVRGFNGALWYWWLNAVVTGLFAILVFVTGRKARLAA